MKFIEKSSGVSESMPKYLYKFYSNLDYAVDVLTNKRLYLTIPSDCNDVFDSARVIDKNELDFVHSENQIDHIIHLARREYKEKIFSLLTTCQYNFPHAEAIFVYLAQNGLPAEEIDRMKNLLCNSIRNAQPNNNRIACFTDNNDSLLMWAHYGNHLKGVCLCFDTSRDTNLFRHIYNVEYQNYRNRERNYNFYFCKAKEWSYEREWRLVVDTKNKYIYTDSCVGVILGEKMPLFHQPTYNKRGKLYPSYSSISFLAFESGLSVFKAVSDNFEYKINIEKRL